MADKYISVEGFTASVQERYCKNCDRRKGMKNGKMKMVYAIGDAPCRACGIDDMVDDIDDYPPADVVEVVRCKDCMHWEDNLGYCDVWDHFVSNQDFFCGCGKRRTDDAQ